MLLSRYGSFTFGDDLPSDTFIGLINKAMEKHTEDKIWDKYLVDLTRMEKEISFDEYKRKVLKQTTYHTNDEEVLQNAEGILKSMNKGR